MEHFAHGAITQIATDNPQVYAFRVNGHIDDDDEEAMAKYMNDVFDTHEKVDMLLDLTGFTGSDWDAMFDGDVLKSRFRSVSKVGKYAVIGAPAGAARMIAVMDKIIPVDARAFDAPEADAAWAFVGAKPVDLGGGFV